MRQHRRPFGPVLVLLAVGVAAMAGCGAQPDGFAARSESSRTWAPLPDEVPMPVSAPDDPKAYRGVRYRMVRQPGGPGSVEVDGRPVSWLKSSAWRYQGVGGAEGPYFGHQQMFDGRRWMLWFFRLVEPPVPASEGPSPPPPMSVATTAPPPRPGSPIPRDTALPPAPPPLSPPPTIEPAPPPPHPPKAVLDVVVLAADDPTDRRGCGGPDPVIINGDDGWRLNPTTGRIEPVDPDDFACPDSD